jgi:serine/threonine-protein kinase
MRVQSIPDLVRALREYRLLTARHMARLTPEFLGRFPNPRAFAQYLVNKQWLTPFQAKWTWRGLANRLALGQYVLLERLGAGGMGQVFRARHRHLEHEAAVKVIHRHLLTDEVNVQRFHREMRVVGQLTHPNIVYAFDAGKVGGTYYLVMELVRGIDLDRLVQEYGPLPSRIACSFMLQAARGLQHAHARGLVHRDIKPANLLITQPSRSARAGKERNSIYGPPWLTESSHVKILDMGLARWQSSGSIETASMQLTQVGMILGTLDFVAPEQAQNSRAADIRSDLYSLGCTFYYLLSGELPFPVKQPVDKLLAHQFEEPRPLEWQRPDLSSSLLNIIRRLMAKAPNERYQTPTELIEELDWELPIIAEEADDSSTVLTESQPLTGSKATVPVHRSLSTIPQAG